MYKSKPFYKWNIGDIRNALVDETDETLRAKYTAKLERLKANNSNSYKVKSHGDDVEKIVLDAVKKVDDKKKMEDEKELACREKYVDEGKQGICEYCNKSYDECETHLTPSTRKYTKKVNIASKYARTAPIQVSPVVGESPPKRKAVDFYKMHVESDKNVNDDLKTMVYESIGKAPNDNKQSINEAVEQLREYYNKQSREKPVYKTAYNKGCGIIQRDKTTGTKPAKQLDENWALRKIDELYEENTKLVTLLNKVRSVLLNIQD